MKKIVLFPYNPDIETIIRHIDYLKGYEIVGVISYKDDDHIIKRINEELGAKDKSYLEILMSCDAIILLDNYRNYKIDKYYAVISDAMKYNLQIVLTPLIKQQLVLDEKICKYSVLGNTIEIDESNIYTEFKMYPILKQIDEPIVGVIGLGKNCGKFDAQMMIKETVGKDYKVISICTNPLGVLFGCFSFPEFLYDERSFQEKIVLVNNYIKQLATLYKPDLIIVGVPEGIAPFEYGETNHYGEYSLILQNAIEIDSTILCAYYMSNKVPVEMVCQFADAVSRKFNASIDGVYVSKTMFETTDSEIEPIIYAFLDEDYLEKNYPKFETDKFVFMSAVDLEEGKVAVLKCIGKLQNNADIV